MKVQNMISNSTGAGQCFPPYQLKGDVKMKMFSVSFNKTGEYGDMYDITNEDVLLADNVEDIISYVMENYMPDATRKENGGIITLSRDVDGYPSYYMHDIFIHEVKIKPLTEKVSYLE